MTIMKKFVNFIGVGTLLICLAASFNAYAQPANDECANAMDISSLFDGACNVSNLSMVIDNTGATGNTTDPPEPGESPTCPQTDDTNLFGDGSAVMETSIWFTFTVPDLNGDGSPVSYSLWTSDGTYGDCGINPNNVLGGDADTQVAIYESNTCPDNTLGECDYFAANEDLFTSPPWISGWLDLMFTPGQTYYMLIDTWDGVVGEFCLSVTPCGTLCGDAACAPVEDYCTCVDCQDECPFGNIAAIEFTEDDPATTDDESGFFFSDDLDGNIFFCSEFVTGESNDNIYLGFGGLNFTDCAGGGGSITVTLSNGTFTTVAQNPDGTYTMPTGALLYIELTPADIAAGSITISGSAPDGIGNTCTETLTINFADFPQASAPYCVLSCFAGNIDPALLNQTLCIGGTLDLMTDGTEDLTLGGCPPGFTFEYAWRILGDFAGTGTGLTPITDWIVLGPNATLDVNDFFIDEFGYVGPYYYPGGVLPPAPEGFYFIQAAAICVDPNGNVDIDNSCAAVNGLMTITLLDENDAACADVVGCTDPCDPNYDPNATVDDPTLCAGYSTDCNTDCTAGPFGGTWDPATCACINETAPVNGCTDAAACNFDATANCDDGTCDLGNTACADPCNPVMGCTDAAACNFDAAACVDDGSCQPAPVCNTDPCAGDLEIVDPNDACACIVDAPQVLGCTDSAACNFEATANCDDGSCDLGNTACSDPCNEPNPDDGCALTTDTFDAATCTVTNTPNCAAGESFDSANCLCTLIPIDGCTDPCDPAYDPASTNDDLCVGYSTDCNADCTAGPFGGTWDPVSCACANETTPVNGCTDSTAGNFDPAANCDDGSCVAACTATAATITGGPFQFCAGDGTPDFVSGITTSGGSGANTAWVVTDDALNILGLPGMPGEVDFDVAGFGTCLIWYVTFDDIVGAEVGMNAADLTGCFALSNSIEVIREDCTDPCTATAATITGGPFQFCAGDGTPDFVSGITTSGGSGANTAWVITDDALNILGLPGMPGEVDFDVAGFGTCLIWYVTFDDIVGAEVGMNAADLTGCFALSNSIEVIREDCDAPCEDDIAGSINADMGCDVTGTAVLITDAAGNPVGMAIADANGDYVLAGGPYPCGEYIATLDVASVPACYTDGGGDVGPAGFTVNGDGTADGANFSSFNEVPTLSQWGLMTLALLLMTFGALKLGFVNNAQTYPNRKK